MYARRSRGPRIAVLVLGGVLVLLIGVLLGGHPSWLPSPLRSAFVSQNDDPLVNQVLDLLQNDYYRPVNRNQLINKGLAGGREPQRPVLALLRPDRLPGLSRTRTTRT